LRKDITNNFLRIGNWLIVFSSIFLVFHKWPYLNDLQGIVRRPVPSPKNRLSHFVKKSWSRKTRPSRIFLRNGTIGIFSWAD
jgi:hypothetical protein